MIIIKTQTKNKNQFKNEMVYYSYYYLRNPFTEATYFIASLYNITEILPENWFCEKLDPDEFYRLKRENNWRLVCKKIED